LFFIDENIKRLISGKANELGFIKTGFAKADVLNDESGRLKQWLDTNYDAGMKWIQKGFDKRKDVRLILPDAKTVISLAYNYYTDFKHDDSKPKISRYAWGKDYHKILKNKLDILCKFIKLYLLTGTTDIPQRENETRTTDIPDCRTDEKTAEVSTLYYVDDGPVMDKAWAVRAGIGWQGKHTNVINPEYGSWIFLCEIITNLDCNVYDIPIEDMCGSCRICIDACPTGAIFDDYKLDSNLCISYQTIENKEDIPEYIDLHGWIFGCDICQDVCPFNKNDKPTNDINFYPKPEIYNKSKSELDSFAEKEFSAIFTDSPVKRTKYSGWKRNLMKL
jgi:epoxyqueuosine reductase